MFNEAERRIFGPYFNGAEMVFADPIRVHRRLHFMLDGETNKYLALYRSENEVERYQAKEKLLPAAIYALDMVPFDPKTGQGSLEQDVMAALRAYLEFMDEKKEVGPILPTCSQPTQEPLAVGPLALVRPLPPLITPPSLPSGVT